MKARRDIGGTAYRLFEGNREIGFIRGGTVGFSGFVNAEEAALAGRVAHLALAARRSKRRPWTPSLPADHRILVDQDGRRLVVAPEGILAALTPPPAGQPDEGWSIDLELIPSERFEVLTIARARAMWTSLLGFGIAGRMRQFTEMSPVPA
jgi:hypothetical protein